MSYVVLARRYRPQTLDQLIGQEHITRTLNNAILESRVAHAYLFSGPRGCGKTTTARILAKALNCKTPKKLAPCGTCPNCVEITGGMSIDVQEIDGASNRGIDEIRALRDNVKFAPATSKYKIYIIDEAHQITDQAFNALLKTLEEPPEHVLFILATTEPQKIPVTILSRCQRYRFRLLSTKEILGALEAIVDKESVIVETAALKIVTSASGGSMRDALSLLDQAISIGTDKVTAVDIENLLGVLPRRILASTAEALAREDLAAVLAIVKDISGQGYNLIQFGRDLREHLRRLLLFVINPDMLDDMIDEEKVIFEQQKPLFSLAWLMRSGHILSRAIDEMRWSDQPRLALEMYLLKLAQKYVNATDLVARLETLEKNAPLSPVIEHPSVTPQFSASAPTAEASASPIVARPVVPVDVSSGVAASSQALWASVVREIQNARPLIGQVLADSYFSEITGATMVIAVSGKFQEDGINRYKELIESAVEKIFLKKYGIRTVISAARPAAAGAQYEEIVVAQEMNAPESPAIYTVEGDLADTAKEIPPEVKNIMSKFPGRMTKKK
ncbi:MAG: DNA polymerase III subunit gamma/tau [Elusimicrobia bacterium]|nr:DNA polymerase III subunit gamma/tau [Elusimicrobiota bacterium]